MTRVGDALPGDTVYSYELSRPLPDLNLTRTPLWLLVGRRLAAQLEPVINRTYKPMVVASRVAMVLMTAVYFVGAHWGNLIVAVLVPLGGPAVVVSYSLLSLDMIRWTLQQHEWWFVTGYCGLNQVLVARQFGDGRAAMTVLVAFALQVTVLVDANFRTFPTMARTIAFGVPVILVQIAFGTLQQLHGHGRTFVRFRHRTVDYVDVLMATSTTIAVFIVRKLYQKHRQSSRMLVDGVYCIPCVMVRARLRLCSQQPQQQAATKEPTSSTTVDLRRGGVDPGTLGVAARMATKPARTATAPRWVARTELPSSLRASHTVVAAMGRGLLRQRPYTPRQRTVLYGTAAVAYTCHVIGTVARPR